MNTKLLKSITTLLGILFGIGQLAWAQSTAFTYQGRLYEGTTPGNGLYDLQFRLYNDASAGSQFGSVFATNGVAVNNGLFTVTLDFGGVFDGSGRWLEVAERQSGAPAFNTLAPRQFLAAAPYATYAASAGIAAGLSGPLTLAQLPAAVLTNNQEGPVTLGGALILPAVPTIYAGSYTLLGADRNGNFFAGHNAWNPTATGEDNTAVGDNALLFNTSGFQNVACGMAALEHNTSGWRNVANGRYALTSNTKGSFNVAVGDGALFANTSGSNNTAIGYSALVNHTGGYANVALGYNAGSKIFVGNNNIDIGNTGLATDDNVIRIGTGQSTTFIAGVLTGDGGGLTNLAGGRLSLDGNRELRLNGYPLFLREAPDEDSGLGWFGSGTKTFGGVLPNGPVLFGGAGGALGTTWGGEQAVLYWSSGGYVNIHGDLNVSGVLNLPTAPTVYAGGTPMLHLDGNGNFFAGPRAGNSTVGGTNNTALGATALFHNTNGSGNIALGYNAGLNATGNNNIDIGHEGLAGESCTIRIGSGAIHTNTFLAGYVGIGVWGWSGSPFYQRLEHWLQVGGAYCDGNIWSPSSDRDLKAGFTPVDAREVLAKVAALPITRWHFTNDAATPHLGPVAQDFHAAFGLGADDKHIADVDEGGVALAAIQGLNAKVEGEVATLRAENAALRARLQKLERLLKPAE